MKNSMYKRVKIIANKSCHTFNIGDIVNFTESFWNGHPIYKNNITNLHSFLYIGDYIPINNKYIK